MIIAGTGHRPNKLGGYSLNIRLKLKYLAKDNLMRYKASKVISGMALGWDTALAEAALELNLPLIAAIPFKGQELRWPKESQDLYNDILSKAREVKYISEEGFSSYKMQIRNEWMVNNCDLILALWNGDLSGGTYNCINYAKAKLESNKIINLWDTFI